MIHLYTSIWIIKFWRLALKDEEKPQVHVLLLPWFKCDLFSRMVPFHVCSSIPPCCVPFIIHEDSQTEHVELSNCPSFLGKSIIFHHTSLKPKEILKRKLQWITWSKPSNYWRITSLSIIQKYHQPFTGQPQAFQNFSHHWIQRHGFISPVFGRTFGPCSGTARLRIPQEESFRRRWHGQKPWWTLKISSF